MVGHQDVGQAVIAVNDDDPSSGRPSRNQLVESGDSADPGALVAVPDALDGAAPAVIFGRGKQPLGSRVKGTLFNRKGVHQPKTIGEQIDPPVGGVIVSWRRRERLG